MSNIVFVPPTGLAWSVFKAPSMSTIVQKAVSGKTSRTQLWANPVWDFKLTWDLLKDRGSAPTDLRYVMDFFLARGGSFDTFLYTDPSDNAVTAQNFGTGNAATTTFQLVRQLVPGGFSEAIQNVNAAQIFDNGVLQTTPGQYSINTLGQVVFVAAPAAGHALTWTGTFYFRLRFKLDLQEFEEFVNQLWLLKMMELVSEKL
jgi:uncharacterized protein (TIGR02217 family)